MDQNKAEDPKVMQLANTLKSHGLAASMYEAIQKAKSILDIMPIKREGQQENTETQNYGLDITHEDATLNELMGEIGVTPEQVKAQEKEKLESTKMETGNITNDIKEAEKIPKK